MATDYIVGIDLGTTNSLVAYMQGDSPVVIPGEDGLNLVPSVVALDEKNQIVVGNAARKYLIETPERAVYSVKRLMGRGAEDIQDELKLFPFQLADDLQEGEVLRIKIGERTYTPPEISALVLRQLKRNAERFFGAPVTQAVITVPAYFNDAQRQATKDAGRIAGLNVLRLVNEPTAASLAYGLDKKKNGIVAVYDLGGGTFDLSILEVNQGVFQVLATNGNTRLGGDDLDKRIIDSLVEKIKAAGGPDPAKDLHLLARLRETAEQTKIQLSSELEVVVSLPFLTPSFSFSCRLSRAELEKLTRDIIARTRPHCLRSLADAKLEAKDLDQVILVGGQTRMPLVRQFVSDLFGCAEFEEARGSVRVGAEHHRPAGPQLNTSQNPDEAVALGAAIQAEILAGGFKNVLLLDVTPLSLGIETFGGLMNVIIPRNSTIPLKAGEKFTTAVDNQREMLIHVLQGERERARDNWSLGKFTLDFEPAPRGVARVGVQFEIDANGILRVLARNLKTGAQKVVELKSAVDVDDAAVLKMVEESVEHGLEDMHSRQWIEAKLRAQETLNATRTGLADCAKDLAPDYIRQVQQALDALAFVLAAEDPESKTGELDKLKAAHAALDEATKPLADLMMDRAMEAMLRQRGLIQ